MSRLLKAIGLTVWLWFGVAVMPSLATAQEEIKINQSYEIGTVTKVLNEVTIPVENQNFYVQEVEVKLNKSNTTRTLSAGSEFQPLNENQRLKVGSQVIVSLQPMSESESQYVLNDVYRLPVLGALLAVFALLVIVVAGRQGAFSIIGMMFSLFMLISFIVPRILAGENPFLITIIGATLTAVITMYVSHGFKRQTHIALVSMLICLFGAALLSSAAVNLGQFVGLGSEDAAFLQFGTGKQINLQGLLLAGILLGTLGILDDITLAQTAVVEQLKSVNPKIDFAELYARSLTVGKDHVSSLVNTLVFAYAGTSLPLFLLFTLYREQPVWVIVNSEIIAEEVIRTAVGSIALVMAVPITTIIASYYVTKVKVSKEKLT